MNQFLVEDLSDFISSELPALTMICDLKGYFVWVNEYWTLITGHSREDMKANPFIHFVHPDDLDDTRAEFKRSLSDKNYVNIDFVNRYRTKDGSYIRVRWFSKFNDEKSHIFGFAVTEHSVECIHKSKYEWHLGKNLSDGLNKFLVSDVPALTSICDTKGNLVWINSHWGKTLDYSDKYITTTPFLGLVHPDDVEKTRIEFHKATSEEGYTIINFQNRYRKRDGEYVRLTWYSKYNKGKDHLFSYALTDNFSITK